jgi:hypothetical protein
MRVLAVLVVSLAMLAVPLGVRAMIAVSVLRPPLRRAAEAAGQCPDVRNGRYVVRLRIEADGRGHDVTLREAPPGITLATEECVARAFARGPYPVPARGERPTGSIMVSFPFVIAGQDEGGP